MELRIPVVIFDAKLTLERYVHGVVASIVQNLGILKMAWSIYQDAGLIARCF